MNFVIFGGVLSLLAIIMRPCIFKNRRQTKQNEYWYLMALSIAGNFLGLFGFYQLATGSISTNSDDYSQILTVLSLLATAVITGFFAWSFTEAGTDEVPVTTAISACFTSLFYILFFALSFYIGKSGNTHNAEYAAFISSSIMFLILVVNTLLDFWDYRDVSGSNTHHSRRKKQSKN